MVLFENMEVLEHDDIIPIYDAFVCYVMIIQIDYDRLMIHWQAGS